MFLYAIGFLAQRPQLLSENFINKHNSRVFRKLTGDIWARCKKSEIVFFRENDMLASQHLHFMAHNWIVPGFQVVSSKDSELMVVLHSSNYYNRITFYTKISYILNLKASSLAPRKFKGEFIVQYAFQINWEENWNLCLTLWKFFLDYTRSPV